MYMPPEPGAFFPQLFLVQKKELEDYVSEPTHVMISMTHTQIQTPIYPYILLMQNKYEILPLTLPSRHWCAFFACTKQYARSQQRCPPEDIGNNELFLLTTEEAETTKARASNYSEQASAIGKVGSILNKQRALLRFRDSSLFMHPVFLRHFALSGEYTICMWPGILTSLSTSWLIYPLLNLHVSPAPSNTAV